MKKTDKSVHQRKVVVVGAGAVGATYCYALAQSGLAELSFYQAMSNMVYCFGGYLNLMASMRACSSHSVFPL